MAKTGLKDIFDKKDLGLWLKHIPRRISLRRFKKNTPLEVISALEYKLARLRLPGVRLNIAKNDGRHDVIIPIPLFPSFENVYYYIAVIIDATMPLSSFYAGLMGEALALEITKLGLNACWVSGNFKRSAVNTKLNEPEKIAAIIPFGLPLGNNKGKERKTLNALCRDNPSTWPLWAYNTAEAVRLAPSALNRQPWRFDFTGNTLRITFKKINSLDAGIAMLHALCALQDVPYRLSIDINLNSCDIFVEDKA
ncbi:MAG: nitroreductase family protein [Eubacteriales bacterium]|nr:nitroreductase family protein [Eubacteriales bacterium]